MKPLVQVQNLSISYQTQLGKVHSVRNIDFSLQAGRTTALVGESGCGKSVTCRSLMGLIQHPGQVDPQSSIVFSGQDVTRFTSKQWQSFRGKAVSMIFQDASSALNPPMPIGRQIAEGLRNHADCRLTPAQLRQAVCQMLQLVGIPDAESCMKRYPHQLSGGMRQRVMIAAAAITKPQLLIADEPTTALDVTIQAQILALLAQLQQQIHMAILLVTHDLGVVAQMADTIVVMYAGKIVEEGPCTQLFHTPQHPYTWALLHAVPRIDQESGSLLNTIEGTLPDAIHPPSGCPFCSRCPWAMNICAQQMPPFTQLSPEHRTACWLCDPRMPAHNRPAFEGGSTL